MKFLDLSGEQLRFEGAVSVENVDGGVVPWRLMVNERPLIAEPLAGNAQTPAGVRLTSITDSTQLLVELTKEGGDRQALDLAVDGKTVQSVPFEGRQRQQVRFDSLPGGTKLVEIHLPACGRIVIHGVGVDDGASSYAWADPRPRWITYGSSITQCRRAGSPTRAWPAMVARAHGWHLTNLGFGGQCHFDPIVARTIARLPADFISLCLGINTHQQSFNARTWLAAVTGFVLTLRDGHPDTPLLVISPIISPPRETGPGQTGLTLELMRQWLAELVDKLQARGDRRIAYLSGLEIIGAGDVGLLGDQVHPEADGIEIMGRRIAEIFAERPTLCGGLPSRRDSAQAKV